MRRSPSRRVPMGCATVGAHRTASLPPLAPCHSIDFGQRDLTIPIVTARGAVQSNEVYPPNDTAHSSHACPSADKRYSLERRILAVEQADIDAIRGWAALHPVIRRAWVFGSRVRGSERPDSDLDAAIEHASMPGDSGPFATWIGKAQIWRDELVPLRAYRSIFSHIFPARVPPLGGLG